MTRKKTPDTNPDIIEGVAVEKSDGSAGRRRSAGHGKARSGTDGAGQSSANAQQDSAQQKSAQWHRKTPDSANPDRSGDGVSSGKETPQRRSVPIMLGVAAIVLALAGIVLQQWMVARQEVQLRAEIERLAAQVVAANDALVRAQAEMAAIDNGQAEINTRLAGIEAELPQDPADALSALSARLDMLAADMAAISAASEAALPPFDTGLANAGLANTGLALAQAGLGAANAMNAANLAGGDPVQWLLVLEELAQAGLDIEGLSGIQALLAPPPAAPPQLLVRGTDLAIALRRDQDDSEGWWQNATGRIAGFIRLRRSDEPSSVAPGQREDPQPVDAFASALRTGNLMSSLATSRKIVPASTPLAAWQAEAQRRLDLDAALVGLMAEMTARLAAAGVAE
jgi:hypothetical protein